MLDFAVLLLLIYLVLLVTILDCLTHPAEKEKEIMSKKENDHD